MFAPDHAADGGEADEGDGEPERRREQTLDHGAGAEQRHRGDAEEREEEELRRAEQFEQFARDRQHGHEQRRANDAADEGGDVDRAERLARAPLPCHWIAVDDCGL